ncbi:MAG: CHAT domain-containing protein [Bacteroidetes bacterium]|nr:MAG: CHAT domain-containing protein [Bacteroidota bacterium]
MNPIIEKALQQLQKANFGGYFDEMDKIMYKFTFPIQDTAMYAEHKDKFISNGYVYNPGLSSFFKSLEGFAKHVDREMNVALVKDNDVTVIQETPKNHNASNTQGNGNTIIQGVNNSTIHVGNVSVDNTNKPNQNVKHKILFLASSPDGMTQVSTDKEYRIIKTEMSQGSHRDFYEFLQPQFSVTISDLLRAMNDEPAYVHFSGHGANQGIYISKEDGSKQLMPNVALERMFKKMQGITKTVLLNSCYSAEQAKIISAFGIYVIGNNIAVNDTAAISFAKGFYNGLGEDKSVEDAYNDAMIVLLTEIGDTKNKVEVWKDGELLDL